MLAGETIVIKVAVHCVSPHGLCLAGAQLLLAPNAAQAGDGSLSGGLPAEGVELETG